MRLLVDAGNTRVKWQIRSVDNYVLCQGADSIASLESGAFDWPELSGVLSAAVSTVVSEPLRAMLEQGIVGRANIPVRFYWSEPLRGCLANAYRDVTAMGADRWHAMYGAWADCHDALVIIDAGSALTVDFVDREGLHLGGYILPGRGMMLRSLRSDAARVRFDEDNASCAQPGVDTRECVIHGQAWLWEGLAARLREDVQARKTRRIYITGGDADLLRFEGVDVVRRPSLVLDGLALIAEEDSPL